MRFCKPAIFVLLMLVAVLALYAATLINGSQVIVGTTNHCADAGSTDDYACDLSPALPAYYTGTHYHFKANTANTGAATFDINSLGAKTIKKLSGGVTTDLTDNDIRAGQMVEVVYDGENFQMLSQLGNAPSGGSGGLINYQGRAGSSTTGTGSYQTIYSATIPANTIGATGCVDFDFAYTATDGEGTNTWRMVYGSTVFVLHQTSTVPPFGQQFYWRGSICGAGSTSAQQVNLPCNIRGVGGSGTPPDVAVVGVCAIGGSTTLAAAEDATSDLTLTVETNVDATNGSFRRLWGKLVAIEPL